MQYLNITEVAAKWGISPRRLQTLCAGGKIPGATRLGKSWMIPKDAEKPSTAFRCLCPAKRHCCICQICTTLPAARIKA